MKRTLFLFPFFLFFLPAGKHNSHIYSTCLSPVKTWVATEPVRHLSVSVIT